MVYNILHGNYVLYFSHQGQRSDNDGAEKEEVRERREYEGERVWRRRKNTKRDPRVGLSLHLGVHQRCF
jgi:hypothetical protein